MVERRPITQAEFAKRLRYVMDEVWPVKIRGRDIAEIAQVAPNTISRWRNPKYASGPPSQRDMQELELAVGLARGSLLAPTSPWKERLEELRDLVAEATRDGRQRFHPSQILSHMMWRGWGPSGSPTRVAETLPRGVQAMSPDSMGGSQGDESTMEAPEDWLAFALRFARMLRNDEVKVALDVRLALIDDAEQLWKEQGVTMASYFQALREEQRRKAS